MKKLKINEVTDFVEHNIGRFHASRLKSLAGLKLQSILSRKNPYLFKAKNMLMASDLVKSLLDAHLSSQEETIFGDFLEGLAVFICGRVYGGTKSAAEGIDLEFTRGKVKYIVAIKSGPNWGNSSQIARMKDNFNKAKKILHTNQTRTAVVAVNGCCYGKDNNPDKGEYLKLCGQRFWEFVSGNDTLYVKIIEPLGHKAKGKNEEFLKAYSQIINKFTLEFTKKFCINGRIYWKRLVRFNSGAR